MQAKNWQISNKKYLFFLTGFLLMIFSVAEANYWASEFYWPARRAERRGIRAFRSDPPSWSWQWSFDLLEGSNPDVQANEYTSFLESSFNQSMKEVGNENVESCLHFGLQVCKKADPAADLIAFDEVNWEAWARQYACPGGYTMEDLINTALDFPTLGTTDGFETRYCFHDCRSGAPDCAGDYSDMIAPIDGDSCLAKGGIHTLSGIFQYCRQHDALWDPLIGDKDNCDNVGGMWDDIRVPNRCRIPQVTLLNVNPWDPATANCGVAGEKACATIWWTEKPLVSSMIMVDTLDVGIAPNDPTNLATTFDPCGYRQNFLVDFSWTYSHQLSRDMSAYRIRMDVDPPFPTEPFNGGQPEAFYEVVSNASHLDSISLSGSSIEIAWRQWLNGTCSGCSIDKWGKEVYWQVQVKDVDGFWSGWSPGPPFFLPHHPYPWPDFDWYPRNGTVPVNTEITFDPFSDISSIGLSTGYPTQVFSGTEQSTWNLSWNFPFDETDFIDPNPHGPIVMFNTPGEYDVTLTVTDPILDPRTGAAMVCDITLGPVDIIWRLPKYREVAPV